MTARQLFQSYLDQCPLVAIIRGVTPDEAEAIGDAVYEGGIRIIEVPLNSPEPLKSIERLAKRFGERMLVGGGTVLTPDDVRAVRDAGGQIIISPNSNTDVISETVAQGMISSPGYFTPSEAFAALRAGATVLKLFPAEGATPAVLKAHLAVLPKDIQLLVVGGVTPDSMQPWLDAGASGFGLGGGLYKPGQSAADTLQKARDYVEGIKR
jgi:2-dehydro-3-deoxyphosphogalactonate aldolase